MRSELRSGLWFVVVGIFSALTHVTVFGLLVAAQIAVPEWANVWGFGIAFGVSFAGHRSMSFPDTALPTHRSLPRFALTAVAGFVCNEAVFVILLRGLGLAHWPALLAAMAAAALQTFLISRLWAFRR